MQELLKLQAEMTKKNTTSLDINTHAANDLKMDVKKLSEINVKAANDAEYKKKREEEVSDSLKKLNATLQIAIKNGLGAATGKKIAGDTALRADASGKSSGLRQFLLGGKKGEEVQSKSITGFTGWVDKQLSKREDKQALKAEKKEFVENAMKHDPTIYARKANFAGGMKTAEGRAIAKEEAEKRFDTIKEKEAAVSKAHEKITAAEQAGYAPLKKDLKARDDATKELGLVDTRMKPIAEGHTVIEEEKASKAKFSADTVKAESDQTVIQHDMGKTLITSLDIQKQQLAALTKLVETGGVGGGGAEGGGSSVAGDLAEAALDNAGGKGGKGKMLGKAGKFLSRNAGKIMKVGGAALAVGTAAYEGYNEYQDAKEEEKTANADVDAKVASGELSKADAAKMKKENTDKAGVKKGEAVGGAVGGGGGALAGAAAGAAIGSIIPGVGTIIGGAVGGAIGYWGGKKAGQAVGGGAVKAAQGFEAGDTVAYDEMGTPIGSAPSSSSAVTNASKTNAELKTGKGKGDTNVVNAPTTINNNNSGGKTDIRAPLRNQESTVNSYIQNRYA
jgi:hypothetical protein